MSGKRMKRLKREFRAEHGREARTGVAEIVSDGTERTQRSDGRMEFKGGYDFHGSLYFVKQVQVYEPSEWRQLKKTSK